MPTGKRTGANEMIVEHSKTLLQTVDGENVPGVGAVLFGAIIQKSN